ncbi:MAG: hypothetical protein JXX29_19605 [Deltaproteobacteria bacterium]|nr:hypothetical protein [Deltaproteobacteria bacterium]MBN2673896.1 hypothetical protein [Deltaproteobacteria bacterium]
MTYSTKWLLLTVCCGLAACSCGASRENKTNIGGLRFQSDESSEAETPSVAVDRESVFNAAKLTAALLAAQIHEDGRFTYWFDLNPARTYDDRYNILRHAGSLYALSQWDALAPSPKVQQKITQGLSYIQDCCVTNVSLEAQKNGVSPIVLAVGSFSAVHGSARPPVAKLGGTGLTLQAISAALSIGISVSVSEEARRAMGRFIVAMQKEDGSFYSKYRLDTETIDDDWQSLYYPGEAALGLVSLYELDGDLTWLNSANRALLQLEAERRGIDEVPHDHWAMIATEGVLEHRENLSDEDVLRHLRHIRQISAAILSRQRVNVASDVAGAFDNYGKTAPAATRVEGLVAGYRILQRHGEESDESLRKQIRKSIERGILFLLRAQVSQGKHAGAIPRAVRPMEKNLSGAKSFNRRLTEVRIDYLQHALSAWIGYLQIVPE